MAAERQPLDDYNTRVIIDNGKLSIWRYYFYTPAEYIGDLNLKVHASLAQDAKNLELAKKILLPILTKHKLHQFKLVDVDSLKAYKQAIGIKDDENFVGKYKNIYGKELTFYLVKYSPGNKPSDWMEIFHEVDNGLFLGGVRRSEQAAMGDMPIPGFRYLSFRDPHNCFRLYIDPLVLDEHGFVTPESANLTGGFNAIFHVNDEQPILNKSGQIPHLVFDEKALGASRIHARFESDLLAAMPAFFGDLNFETVDQHPIPFKDFIVQFANLFNSKIVAENNQKLVDYYQRVLLEAAKHVAILGDALLKAKIIAAFDYGDIGRIVPVIYHYFIRPIMDRVQQTEPYGMVSVESVNREALILEVVKCSFRLREPQLANQTPKYVGGLSEFVIDQLAQQVLKYKQPKHGIELAMPNKSPSKKSTPVSEKKVVDNKNYLHRRQQKNEDDKLPVLGGAMLFATKPFSSIFANQSKVKVFVCLKANDAMTKLVNDPVFLKQLASNDEKIKKIYIHHAHQVLTAAPHVTFQAMSEVHGLKNPSYGSCVVELELPEDFINSKDQQLNKDKLKLITADMIICAHKVRLKDILSIKAFGKKIDVIDLMNPAVVKFPAP